MEDYRRNKYIPQVFTNKADGIRSLMTIRLGPEKGKSRETGRRKAMGLNPALSSQ